MCIGSWSTIPFSIIPRCAVLWIAKVSFLSVLERLKHQSHVLREIVIVCHAKWTREGCQNTVVYWYSSFDLQYVPNVWGEQEVTGILGIKLVLRWDTRLIEDLRMLDYDGIQSWRYWGAFHIWVTYGPYFLRIAEWEWSTKTGRYATTIFLNEIILCCTSSIKRNKVKWID